MVGSVFVWDLAGSRRLGRPFRAGGANDRNARYALSSDGRLLAVGEGDGAVSIFDARTLARRAEFLVATLRRVLGMAFVPGSHLLVVGGQERFLALVDADSRHACEVAGRRLSRAEWDEFLPGRVRARLRELAR